jgi:hypothetical protein
LPARRNASNGASVAALAIDVLYESALPVAQATSRYG